MIDFLKSRIFNRQSQNIASAAFILAAASLASRFFGLIRDRLLASHLGAGDTLDAYYAAFRLPDLVFNLVVLGALSAGFIPIFIGLWRGGAEREKAWRFVNNILNILLLILAAVGLVFILLAPWVMRLVTPGFDAEKMRLTVGLARLMFLSPVLLGLSSVWSGVLQGVKRFFIFSLAPVFYNLGIIIGILFFVPRWGAYGLAWGVALGAFLHFAIQWPAVRWQGFRYHWVLDWRDQELRRLVVLMGPRILALALAQLNFLAVTILASRLASGSLAIFNLAFNIWSLPLGVLALPLAMAAFPVLAETASQQDRFGFIKNFSSVFRQILFLVVPASVLMIVLRAQAVRLILGAGKFNWEDTILTIQTLQFLLLGLLAESLIFLLIRGFFALEDTRTPFLLGLISSIGRISLAWFLSLSMGVAGLALGYVIGGIINAVLLWLFLERKMRSLDSRRVLASGLKILAASLAAGAAAWLVLWGASLFLNTHTFLGLFGQGLLAGLVGLAVYLLTGLFLHCEEIGLFWNSVKNRLPFKSAIPEKELMRD